MNIEILKAMGDAELGEFYNAAAMEIAARKKQRKEEAISKIKELSSLHDISVVFRGQRGRPPAKAAVITKVRAAAAK